MSRQDHVENSADLAEIHTRVESGQEPATEKCMFCETRIEVPEPNAYVVICTPCRKQAYETADKFAADRVQRAPDRQQENDDE